MKKDHLVIVKMSKPEFNCIADAAHRSGMTPDQFVVQAAHEKANAVIDQEGIIRLPEEAAVKVLDLMKKPPRPNKRLVKAMKLNAQLIDHKRTQSH